MIFFINLIFIIIKLIYKNAIKYAYKKRINNKINFIAIYNLCINDKKEIFILKNNI